jgi:hypothetical protein
MWWGNEVKIISNGNEVRLVQRGKGDEDNMTWEII